MRTRVAGSSFKRFEKGVEGERHAGLVRCRALWDRVRGEHLS